jgi:crossover junction endodeoxyribonuclease RuvC
MIYIGVDPGLRSGAVAAINHNKSVVFCSDIPQIDDRIDVLEFKKLILHAAQDDDFAICFEHVGVMPGQGISSSGRFMRAYGSIETVCRLLSKNIVSVRPQVWKKEIGVTAEKETSLRVARLLFPDTDLSLKKHHNKAEALLIAEYARRNQ